MPVEQRRATRGDVVVPADEAGELGRHVGAGPLAAVGAARGSARSTAQVDLLQRGRRVDAELVGQPAADVLVRGQRVGLPAGGVERADQLAARAARAAGGPGDEGLQLGQHLGGVGTERQLGLDAVLGGGEPALVQRGRPRRPPRAAGGVGQGRAAPQRERLARAARRAPAGSPSASARRPAAASRSNRWRRPPSGRWRAGSRPDRTRPRRRPAAPGAAGRPATAARWPRRPAARRPRASATSARALTGRPASSASRVSRARSRAPPTSTGRPASSVTSSGPRIATRTRPLCQVGVTDLPGTLSAVSTVRFASAARDRVERPSTGGVGCPQSADRGFRRGRPAEAFRGEARRGGGHVREESCVERDVRDRGGQPG